MKPTDEQINAAIELLRGAGYRVERPEWGPWQKPWEVWKPFKSWLSYVGFHCRLRSFQGEYPQRRGPSGRLIVLRTTPELLSWLSRPLQPGIIGRRTS